MRNLIKVIVITVCLIAADFSVVNARVIDELNYVSDKTDFYSYINFTKIMNFIKVKGIDINDIDAMMSDNSDNDSAKVINAFGLKLSDVNEFLMVINTRDVEKKSGYLVFMSFKNGKGVIPESFKKESVKLKSGTAYKASADEDILFVKVDDFFVIGPSHYIDSFLERRASKKPLLSSGSSLFIKKTASKSISFQLSVSEYLRNTMNTALNSGEGMARGLKENVFVQTLLSLESMDWGFEINDKITFQSGLQGSKAEDSERLEMLCHTWIVASSFVVPFADMLAARAGDQKITELTGDQQLMLWIQKAFGRIHTRREGNGVVITFEMNPSETDMLISFLKKEIDKEKKSRAERIEREKISRLTLAIKDNNLANIERFIKEKYNLNGFDADGNTPLCTAAMSGNIKAAGILIEKGAGLNIPDINKLTPLHHAVKIGNKEIVNLLLSKGSNIAVKDDSDMTPLHLNAIQGDSSITKILLAKGASVNAVDIDASTPLHLAASEGRIDVVKILADNKADPELLNRNDQRAIDSAAQNSHTEIVEYLKIRFKQEPKSTSSEGDFSGDNSDSSDGAESNIESEDPVFEEDVN